MDANSTVGYPVAGSTQSVAYTAASALSAVLPADCRVVRLTSSTDCRFRISSAGDAATAADCLLIANMPEYFGAVAGGKVAAIQVAAAGSIDITPMQ